MYIYGTMDIGLQFTKDDSQGLHLVGYVDLNFTGDLDKRKSTTGYLFTLAGASIYWRSILQYTVPLSTTEAEYMAVTKAIKKVIWLLELTDDFRVGQDQVHVMCDSQSAIHLANN